MSETPRNRLRHLIALGAGIVAVVVLFQVPSGPVGYLIAAVVAGAAVIIGHRAVVNRGSALVAAIIGLVLGYLVLLLSAGLLAVSLIRLFTGA